jgi:hypothetical protein
MTRSFVLLVRLGIIASAIGMLIAIGHVHAAQPERPVPVAIH